MPDPGLDPEASGHARPSTPKPTPSAVMPALVAGTHVLSGSRFEDVDGRDEPGHDDTTTGLSGKYEAWERLAPRSNDQISGESLLRLNAITFHDVQLEVDSWHGWHPLTMASRLARILILCKTYPSPSGKYSETSCVAGMEDGGRLIRLFPVPFRLIGDGKKFKKWQWINTRVESARSDRRQESHNIYVDTISFAGDPLSTAHDWRARREQLNQINVFDDFRALDQARETSGVTLGLLRPSSILGLDITPVTNPDWTDEERQKLLQHQQQGGLFDATDAKSISTLKKLPFDFHYRYACSLDSEVYEYRHKIVDWEAGALFWNCYRADRRNWEKAFRAKMEKALPDADLMFLMGTIHRFPNQWLIVSLIYPPKLPHDLSRQRSLFDL